MKKILFVLMHSAPYRDPVINEYLRENKSNKIDIVYLYGAGVLTHPEWKLEYVNYEVIPHKTICFFGKKIDLHMGLIHRIRNYDIILIGGYYPIINLALLIKANLYHKKVIYSCDTISFKKGLVHNIIYKFIQKSSAYFVPGLKTKTALISDLGINENRIFLGSYLIDSKDWSNKLSAYNKEDSTTFKLLFVGVLREIRNIPLLMDVMENIRNKDVNVELIFIGDGNWYKDSLTRQIERGGIKWIPVASYNLLAEYYANADCYIHPGKEPYSLALSQAAFAGIPIISHYGVGAVDDYVKNNYNGIVINKDDVKEFVDAILKIKENKVQFSENAKKHSKELLQTHSVDWGIKQLASAIEMCKE